VGPDLAPVSAPAAAGSPLFLPVDVSSHVGPFDLYVNGTQGSDPATLQIGELTLPQTLDLGQLQAGEVDLPAGLTARGAAGAFGRGGGVKYQQLAGGGGKTALTVQGSGGAEPLLVRYQESGGLLHLEDFALPDPNTAKAELLAEDLPADQLEGVAAFALGF